MTDISAVRLELSTFAAGKPKAVQRAVANLDGWLIAASSPNKHLYENGVAVLACTARAVETLRDALRIRS